MLVDANIQLYSVDERSSFHEAALDWLTDALESHRAGRPIRCPLLAAR